jgi:hypothetical protein
MEEEDSYIFFQYSRNGKLTRVMQFDKKDYTDYGHFLGGITRFFPSTFFLKEPIPFESISLGELDRIFKQINDHSEGGDRLKPAKS